MARRNEALEGSVRDLQESAQHGDERSLEAFAGLQGAMDRLREHYARTEETLKKREDSLQWYRQRLHHVDKNYTRVRREAVHAQGLADDRLAAIQRAERRLEEVERKSSEEIAGLHREASRLWDEVERVKAANQALRGREALLEKQVCEAEGVHRGLMAEIDILKKDAAKMELVHKKALAELSDEVRRRDDRIAQGQAREDKLCAELEGVRRSASTQEELLQREKKELSERVDILEAERSALETRASEIEVQASAELQKAAVEAYKRSGDFQGVLTAHGGQAFSEGFDYCKSKILSKFPDLGLGQVTISSSSEDEAGSGSDFED